MIKAGVILVFSMVTLFIGYKTLRDVQSEGYRVSFNLSKQFVYYAAAVGIAAIGLGLSFLSELAATLFTGAAAVAASVYFGRINNNLRTKYKFTARGKRLFAAAAVATVLYHVLITIFIEHLRSIYLANILASSLAPLLMNVVSAAMHPFEERNNMRYEKAAASTLAAENLIKIGITGSYGKTSCKNILAAMLARGYSVLATEGSFNTPMGIALTAKKYNGEEVFIAEMGARRKGDIARLSGIVRPRYAIITAVAAQHIATFKTIDRVYEAKKELPDSLPKDGFAVFGADCFHTRKMADECAVGHVTAGLTGDVRAENLKMGPCGLSFTLTGIGEPFEIKTKLLGRHNAENIAMCAALAAKLGISRADIAEAVCALEPVPHRLQPLSNGRITIIDDSYNCNIEGAKTAFETLGLFEGRKVVFTQGITEQGAQAEKVNSALGMLAAGVADEILLCGENSDYIKSGAEKAGFGGDIRVFRSLEETKESFPVLLKAGDVLLIQNDIP